MGTFRSNRASSIRNVSVQDTSRLANSRNEFTEFKLEFQFEFSKCARVGHISPRIQFDLLSSEFKIEVLEMCPCRTLFDSKSRRVGEISNGEIAVV